MTSENYSIRTSQLKLPKLKAQKELLQALPSLAKYLNDVDTRQTPTQHSKKQQVVVMYDSDEEQEKESQRIREELKQAKKERHKILNSLARLRIGPSNGNLQAEDIQLLRHSLAQKQEMLNDLRNNNAELEQKIEELEMERRDFKCLIPDEGEFGNHAVALSYKLKSLEEGAMEVQGRSDQYRLLQDRTRNDRNAAEHRMCIAREVKNTAAEDMNTLIQYYHEVHAAKEMAEKMLGAAVAQLDQVRDDWQRKLRNRRKEVQQIEKRIAAEANELAMKNIAAAQLAERERLEYAMAQEMQKSIQTEKNNAAVLEQCHLLENIWAHLRAIASASAASTPQHIVTCWQDLSDRAAALQDLLRLTRQREAQLKEQLKEYNATQCVNSIVDSSTSKDIVIPASSNTANSSATQDHTAAYTQHHRVEQLCAAAELCLSTILARLMSVMHIAAASLSSQAQSHPPTTTVANEQCPVERQQNDENSNQTNSKDKRPSIAYKRKSALMPRRVSAIDLSNARKGINAHNETALVSPRRVSLLPPPASAATVDALPEAPQIIKKIDEQLDAIISNTELKETLNLSLDSNTNLTQQLQPQPQQHKRSTLAGPAWILIPDSNSIPTTIDDDNIGLKPIKEEDTQHIERYIKRLVGATADLQSSLPNPTDPFTLESSDDDGEDDGNISSLTRNRAVVMDRAAVKHRSYKITHPKLPKK